MAFEYDYSRFASGGVASEDDDPPVVGCGSSSLAKLAALASSRFMAVEARRFAAWVPYIRGVMLLASDLQFANKGAIADCFGHAYPATVCAYSLVSVASHRAGSAKETACDAVAPTQAQLDDPGFIGDAMISVIVDQVVFTEHSAWQSLMRFFADEYRTVFVRDTIARGISAPRPFRTAHTPPPPPKDVIGDKRVVARPLPGAFNPSSVKDEGGDLEEIEMARLNLSASPSRSSIRSSSSSPSPRKLSFADAAILHPHITRDAVPRARVPLQPISEAAAETQRLHEAFGTKSEPHPLATGEFEFAFGLGKRWIDMC